MRPQYKKLTSKKINSQKRKIDTFLENGIKGKVFVIIKKAYELGGNKNFNFNYRGVEKLEDIKNHSVKFYSYSKPGSAYWNLEDTSEEFNSLYLLAKESQTDIINNKWSKKVQELLNKFFSLRVPKIHRFDAEILKEIKL